MAYQPDMTVDALDAHCRPFVWQYTDPVFMRYYAWFPDEGNAAWWYSNGDGWFESCAGSDDVDSATITHGSQKRGTHRFRCITTLALVESSKKADEAEKRAALEDKIGSHEFCTYDGIHCYFCGQYPFDLLHWTI